MAEKKEAIELAEKIYNLDNEAYKASGSGLGHIYTDDREASINEIVRCMETPEVRFKLHQQLALIGNMAHTIENPIKRDEILSEYEETTKAFHDFIDRNGGPMRILDPIIASLNSLSLKNRMDSKHLIICISRSTASGGSHVGIELAEKLNIDYLDSKIIAKMIRTLEITEDLKDTTDNIPSAETPNLEEELLSARHQSGIGRFVHMRNRYHGLNMRDASFFRMSEILIELAKKQDFVIVGRAADRIFTSNRIPHISIFITAPLESRVKRVQAIHDCDARTARRILKADDNVHAKYYNYYTGLKWGDANNYDLCLNSASYGIDGCVDLIMNMISGSNVSS
ncbi:MAG: cytidylate kinase-like family protein [Lachnospiraceae bacterium]|nr:cytidylate kinase-like family protein [Lachnospiraceae bacterium]